MGMNYEIMRVIGNKYPSAKLDRVDAATSDQIDTWDVAYGIKTLFRLLWFSAEFDHAIGFYSSQEIARLEAECGNLANGYLLIGNCGTGDRVYLDKTDNSVHYWSHDRAHDWDRVESTALVRVYPTIFHLLIALYEDRYIPWRSYSAQEYTALMTVQVGVPPIQPKQEPKAKAEAKVKAR